MESDLLLEAFKLLLLGMGFVYLFLGVTVLAIKALAYVAAEPATTAAGNSPSGSSLPTHTVAAIAAAVHRYRNDHSHPKDTEHQP